MRSCHVNECDQVTGVLREDTRATVHYTQLRNLSPANEVQKVSGGLKLSVCHRLWKQGLGCSFMALGYRTARLSLGGGEVLPFGCHKFSKWNPFYFSLLIHGFSATQKALLIALPFTPLDPSVNCWFCYRAFQAQKPRIWLSVLSLCGL